MIANIARIFGFLPDQEEELRFEQLKRSLEAKLESFERLSKMRGDHISTLNSVVSQLTDERDAAVTELAAHIKHAEEYTQEHVHALELRDREIDLLRSMKQARPRSLKRVANALAQPRGENGTFRK